MDEISIRMSNSLSAVALVLMVLGTYVLVFSSISLLYKVVIVVYIFVLLFLFSLALLSLETIGEPRRRVKNAITKNLHWTWNCV